MKKMFYFKAYFFNSKQSAISIKISRLSKDSKYVKIIFSNKEKSEEMLKKIEIRFQSKPFFGDLMILLIKTILLQSIEEFKNNEEYHDDLLSPEQIEPGTKLIQQLKTSQPPFDEYDYNLLG